MTELAQAPTTARPAAGPAPDPTLPPDPTTQPAGPAPLSGANKGAVGKAFLVIDEALMKGDLQATLDGLKAAVKALGGELTHKDFPVIAVDAVRGSKLTGDARQALAAQVYNEAMTACQAAFARGEFGVALQAVEAAQIAVSGGRGRPVFTADAVRNLSKNDTLLKMSELLNSLDPATLTARGFAPEQIIAAREAVMNALPEDVGKEMMIDQLTGGGVKKKDDPKPVTPDEESAMNESLKLIRSALLRDDWRSIVQAQDALEMMLNGDQTLRTRYDAATVCSASMKIAQAAAERGRMDIALQAIEAGYIARYGGTPVFTPERIEAMMKKDPNAAALEILQISMNLQIHGQQTGHFDMATEATELYGQIILKLPKDVAAGIDSMQIGNEASRAFGQWKERTR